MSDEQTSIAKLRYKNLYLKYLGIILGERGNVARFGAGEYYAGSLILLSLSRRSLLRSSINIVP